MKTMAKRLSAAEEKLLQQYEKQRLTHNTAQERYSDKKQNKSKLLRSL